MPAAETLTFDELKPHWNGFFKEKTFFSYHRCAGCGSLYSRNFFDDEQLGALYAQMPDNTAGLPLRAMEKTQRGYFDELRKHGPLTGHYLEIGPDIGLFTRHCVNEGNFEHFWLFEPNQAVHPQLAALLPMKRFDIVDRMHDYAEIPDKSVGTLVMIHVLDHIIDPLQTLTQLRHKLRDDAIVLFVTHDESSFLARLTKHRWPAYCLQHPHLFRPQSISFLLNRAGFDVLTIKKTYNYFPVLYLAQHLLWALGAKLKLPTWYALQLGLKLGNIATIARPSKERSLNAKVQ